MERDAQGAPHEGEPPRREPFAEAVRESEARLRLATEAAGMFVWDTDVASGEIRWSENAARVIGVKEEELPSVAVEGLFFVAEEEHERLQGEMLAAMGRGETTFNWEFRGVEAGEATKHWRSQGLVVYGEKGPVRIVGVTHDVTGEWRAQEALRGSEERFRKTFENAAVGIALVGLDGRILATNKTLGAFWGYGERELVGKGFQEITYPEDLAADMAQVGRILAGEIETYTMEKRYLTKEGGVAWALLTVGLARKAGGEPDYFISVVQDIGKRKRAEEGLKAAKAEAEAASAAKDRFLAALSHELRTPLTPVKMQLAAWSRDEAFPEGLRSGLEMMRRNVDLEARLIDDLLDLHKVARGKLVLQWAAVEVEAEVRHAVESVLAEAAVKGVNLRLEAHAHERGVVQADAARLQQVFWNLLKNAVKFTPEGGTVTVRTKVQTGEEGQVVRVEVQDTGIGIAEEVLPRVFHAFEQGGLEVTREFGGMGLGLAISKAIVELHEGKVWAESAGHGQGATFVVEMPLAQERESCAGAREGRPGKRGDGRIRLLLVEDHEDTARVMERVLKAMGHHVRRAGCVREAVAMGTGEAFDLLVSDIGLPDGSGLEVMRELREALGEGVKGIALTGYGMEEDIRRTREAGFLEHLTKPVDLEHLDGVIRRVVGG